MVRLFDCIIFSQNVVYVYYMENMLLDVWKFPEEKKRRKEKNIVIKQNSDKAEGFSNLKNLGIQEAPTSKEFFCVEETSTYRNENLAIISPLKHLLHIVKF